MQSSQLGYNATESSVKENALLVDRALLKPYLVWRCEKLEDFEPHQALTLRILPILACLLLLLIPHPLFESSLALFELRFTGIGYDTRFDVMTEMTFGVHNICITSFAAVYADTFSGPRPLPECVLTQEVGIIANITPNIAQPLFSTVLGAHMLSAGLIFVASLPSSLCGSRILTIIALILSTIAALMATMMLAVDVVLVEVMKVQTEHLINYKLVFGYGVWVVVCSNILIWVSIINFFVYLFSIKTKSYGDRMYLFS